MAIFRGDGGAGDSNNDATLLAVTQQAVIATTKASDAADSAVDAANSATTATTKAAQAAASATDAANSATGVAAYATAAENSATAAATSETNAATSATASASSATAASASETASSASETASAASATTATTKASEAATSAISASTSASTATTKASEAATSASNASTSEANAATSASNAATSATASSDSATASAASASDAATSETNAATSATNASNSATAASTSETNASNSATAAATSETNAATSASSASASATTAATKATEASTSATSAATSATDSANSATSAGTAQTAAEAARDAALAAFDSFDDRYLGQKASDPTVDNDGDPLVAGTLYFNTTDDIMKVYEGSLWVAAYASLSGALLSANNLSDLNNAATARTNLGLGTAATTASTDYATAAQGSLADSALQSFTETNDLTASVTWTNVPDVNITQSSVTQHETAFTITESQISDLGAYLTNNQTITLTGDASGSGTTSIAVTVADDSHNHIISNVDGLQTALDGKVDDSQVLTNVPSGAVFTDTTYSVGDGGLTEINFTSADHTKLNGIETGATADQTAAEILTAIKTVDGSGSGLDADLLDGQQGSYYYPASNPSGYTTNTGTVTEGGTTFNGTYPLTVRTSANVIYSHPNITFTGASNTLAISGNTVWHAGNDGSGSGLDADTVDGLQAGSFLRSDASDTATGTITFNAGIDLSSQNIAVDTNKGFVNSGAWTRNATPYGYIDIGPANTSYGHIYTDRPSFYFNKELQVNGNTVWNAGNDGSGSGLDADTVDGLQASSFVRSDASDIKTGTLNLRANLDMRDDSATAGRYVHLPRGGGVTFYGDASTTHSITSRNSSNVATDDLFISSYGSVYVALDRNNNQTSTADFVITQNGSTATAFKVDGETSRIGINEASPTYAIHANHSSPSGGQQNHFQFNATYGGIEARNYYGIFYLGNPSGGRGISMGYSGVAPGRSDTLTSLDNTLDLGASSNRWDDVYATNGTIQTSDEREKQDIAELDDAEQRVAVAAKGLLRKFRWKDSVAEKGEEARTHFGIIAQDLQAAFVAEGLDPSDYAMFIKTEWWIGDKTHPAIPEELDEDGNVVVEGADEHVEENHTYDNEDDAPSDATYHYRLGIRYSELLAFIIAAI